MLSFDIGPQSVIGKSSRHLKSKAFDAVEYVLLLATGFLLGCVVVSVAVDVISRLLSSPVLWIQEATLITFVWSIFVGASAAVRRGEHFSIVSRKKKTERKQRTLELINGIAAFVVGVITIFYGFRYFVQQFHNSLPVTSLPLSVMAGALPVFGVFLSLFTAERVLLGLQNGFVGEEEAPEFDEVGEPAV